MSARKRVAVFGTEPVTDKIGGLGIRQLEISRVLSRHFEVRLFTPYKVLKHSENFAIEKISYPERDSVKKAVEWAEVIFAGQPHQNITHFSREMQKPLAMDLFPIIYFEEMERFRLSGRRPAEKKFQFSGIIAHLFRQLSTADFYICASERERDYYLGILTVLGKVKPNNYENDKHFRNLIEVVPFGIPKREPRKGKNLLRGKIPGIGMKDFLIVWGGSLWNWYDCLTPVRAMARLKTRCPRAKLVFTCTTHPATGKPPEEYVRTLKLAKQKGVLDKNVFFYCDWVPHSQRDYYLTESDAGITTFHDHIENHFSFRIRLMDYMWANLPIIANPGSTLSDLIEREGLGVVFPFGDDRALAERIEWMAKHPAAVRRMRERMAVVKKEYRWEKVLAPLVKFIKNPSKEEPLFDRNGFSMSFFEINRLKPRSILFLRSSPIEHSREGIKALRKIAPDASIDVVIQRDMAGIELDESVNIVRMPSNRFNPEEVNIIMNNKGPYDTVVCALSNNDMSLYSNVIGFASRIEAQNYLAFNDCYQFNNINSLCREFRSKV